MFSVAVLEDVKPIPRWLLYLRPRQEKQWLLFFNETVTYALEREVFGDNFGGDTETTSGGIPARRPVLLLYLRESSLDDTLDS